MVQGHNKLFILVGVIGPPYMITYTKCNCVLKSSLNGSMFVKVLIVINEVIILDNNGRNKDDSFYYLLEVETSL